MAFSLFSITSLLFSASAFPFLELPPLPLLDQNPQLPASLVSAPAASPIAAPVGGANQQQPWDGSVSGGSADQEPEAEQGNVQPTGSGAGVAQAVGFAAQPLVDNTPFDSGSSRMGMGSAWSWFECAYALALAWFTRA